MTVADHPHQERTEAALRECEARLALAAELGDLGQWDLDLETFELATSGVCHPNFKRDPDAPFTYADLIERIHPDDRERQQRAVAAAIENRSSLQVAFRVVTPAGETRHIEVRGHFAMDGGRGRLRGVSRDITERKRVDAAQRGDRDRQAFVLKLSDALRAESNADVVADTALRMLADELDVDRCCMTSMDTDQGRAQVTHQVRRANVPAVPPMLTIAGFPWAGKLIDTPTVVYNDVASELGVGDHEKRALASLQFGALVAASVRIGKGRPVWALVAVSTQPRHWTSTEIALLEQAAERTWTELKRARVDADLLDKEQRLRLACDATALGTFVWYPQEARAEPDARMLELFGQPPDGDLDFAAAADSKIHSDDTERYAAALARALDASGNGALDEEIRVALPGGKWRWVAVRARTRFAGAPQRAVRMSGTARDISERKHREAQLRLLASISEELARLVDVEATMSVVAARIGAYFNASACTFGAVDAAEQRVAVTFEWKREGVPSTMDRHRVDALDTAYPAAACRAGETCVVRNAATDTRVDAARMAARSIGSFVTVPLVRGGVWRFQLTVFDTVPRDWREGEIALLRELDDRIWTRLEQTQAELARRASETRNRQILDSAIDYAIMALDIGGCITLWNEGAGRVLGWSESEMLGQSIEGIFTPEDVTAGQPAHEMQRARADERGSDERWHMRKGGERFWASGEMTPLRNDDGVLVGFVKVLCDRTEQRRAEQHRRLLINELNHRVKNTLATVQALAVQTFRGSGAQHELDAFEARLLALSAVHDVLTRENWKAADIREIVRNALAAWSTGTRISMDGPKLSVRPPAALALAMALHELATNAVKYGALSDAAGVVAVHWRIADDEPPRFGLRWRERGGPPVRPPSARGFGSRLVQHALARDLGGTVELLFDERGVRCTIDAPLIAVREEGADA